jgi:hypothetical protein
MVLNDQMVKFLLLSQSRNVLLRLTDKIIKTQFSLG